MKTKLKTNVELLEENERLRLRLEEADAVVEAIRSGIVDAVVVHSTPGESVYTLEGAERPYRLLVEAMPQQGSRGAFSGRCASLLQSLPG